jgi:hypothetical protein
LWAALLLHFEIEAFECGASIQESKPPLKAAAPRTMPHQYHFFHKCHGLSVSIYSKDPAALVVTSTIAPQVQQWKQAAFVDASPPQNLLDNAGRWLMNMVSEFAVSRIRRVD